MTGKTNFFEEWSWFKFHNLGLTRGMNLQFYTNVTKGLNKKFRNFRGLVPTFLEVTGEKLVGGAFCPSSILNRVNKLGKLVDYDLIKNGDCDFDKKNETMKYRSLEK